MELILRFSNPQQVVVVLDGEESSAIDFTSPVSDEDLSELRWYVETYAAAYTTEIDDDRANRQVVKRLQQWGTALFQAVFQNWDASQLFNQFLSAREPGRVLTISAKHPEILALPWELLHVPGSAYLFNEKPQIAMRRNLAGTRGGRAPMAVQPKAQLRLLFVVSRPSDAGFIDPRSDGLAVMAALAETERVTVEWLRPATLDNLERRLADKQLPPVDILHFDGHGVFHTAKNVGYLLFEAGRGGKDLVSAERLGQLLHQQGLGLVVLSACQSAMTAGEEAIGSVAAGLTDAGVRSVVAMSYSVLVSTTKQLFGAFYQELLQGYGVGESLDRARRQLFLHREREERQRGRERVTLELADWFVPTLYQVGADVNLICPEGMEPELELRSVLSNLPDVPQSGFWGRQRELWQIERALTPKMPDLEIRRVTIAGFGGQGKTALAQEAGRWLTLTGMFDAVCFVDYAAFQGRDPVGWAVISIATVLQENLIDEQAVGRALGKRSTLVILDNLEDVEPEGLQELLTVAKDWSEAGQSRVLLTTRQMEWNHPDYPSGGSYRHQLIQLQGLGAEQYPQAAIDYFQALMKLPPEPEVPLPERSALINLFKLVDWHPLSIRLVAEQLRTRRVAEVGQALERLLAEVPTDQSKDKSLIASLNLSLERLDGQAQSLVRRLSVFEGGALEYVLLQVTQLTTEQWQPLRRQLVMAGLVQPEALPGISTSYLRFHPTLAQVLWVRLSKTEQDDLKQRHREQYYELSGYLHNADDKNPYSTRSITIQELPNLLVAVRRFLAAEDEWAAEFVNSMNKFLDYFGMNRGRAELTTLAEAAVAKRTTDSRAWFVANHSKGVRFLKSNQPQTAIQTFQDVLQKLSELPSYERCLTLGGIGQCYKALGHLEEAKQWYEQELIELEQLDVSTAVKREIGGLQASLGDLLRDMGQLRAARQAYEKSILIAQEQGDQRQICAVEGQLGTLALHEGNLLEAETRYIKALDVFQYLNEPTTEAIFWNQLGCVYQEAQAWESAEQAFREAARIHEAQGNLAETVGAWNNLATVMALTGKLREAEEWYRKTIVGLQDVGDLPLKSSVLGNLANLLSSQPSRISEAHQIAEEALVIKQTLDPAATDIWTTYMTLADIAIQQNDLAQAQIYRRLEQQTYATTLGQRLNCNNTKIGLLL